MQHFHVRIHVSEEGRITGAAPAGVPAGDHDVSITFRDPAPHPDPAGALAAVHRLQDQLARLPVLDPRSPDDILEDDASGFQLHGD